MAVDISFRASTQSPVQTGIPSNTPTKVQMNLLEWDVGGYFDSTNFRWTPPAGVYRVTARVSVRGVKTGEMLILSIRKNANTTYRSVIAYKPAAGLDMYVELNDLVYADGNDTFEVWINGVTDTALTVIATGGSGFSGNVVGGKLAIPPPYEPV